MSDYLRHQGTSHVDPPPPAPPLPQQGYTARATSALARLAHPFFYGSRPPSPQPSDVRGDHASATASHRRRSSASRSTSTKVVTHGTGIPISALDISPHRTHVVLAGREILKTLRVTPDTCTEEFNLRSAIVSYSSPRHTSPAAQSAKHKDQLAAKDVRWSHGNYDRIIATAAANGRIVVYDLDRPGLELGRFHEHGRQVHRLAFNPHRGAWLLSGSQDATIRMWDLRIMFGERAAVNFGSKYLFNPYSDAVRDVRWSPVDGVEFATATDSGAIQRWDVRKDNAPLMKINAHERTCFAVDWHPDGKHLVSGGLDRLVKVWNFSTTDRRQKPCFQLRAPQAVMNVRWRPPSWTIDSSGAGASSGSDWRSTQIATFYDQEDPRVHLWDFRRPHVPFRELDLYNRAPSDMLWNSKDLLWTVGSDGIFSQRDVRFASEIPEQRPYCAIAWGPGGNIVAFGRRHTRRRKPNADIDSGEYLAIQPLKSPRGETTITSRSLTDDGLEDSAVAAALSARKRSSRSTYSRGSKSLSGTPPMSGDGPRVLPLEQAVASDSVYDPRANGYTFTVADTTFNPIIFRWLSHNYWPMRNFYGEKWSPRTITTFLDSFEHNAIQAESVCRYRLAQTWRTLRFVVEQYITIKSERQQSLPINKPVARLQTWQMSGRRIITNKLRKLEGGESHAGSKSGRLKAPVDVVVPSRRSVNDIESTSTMTTPLAQPLPDSPNNNNSSGSSGDFDGLSSIGSLPPSLLHESIFRHQPETDTGSVDSQDLADEVESHEAKLKGGAFVAPRSLSPERMRIRELERQDMIGDGHRSAPRNIGKRADWRLQDEQHSFLRQIGVDEDDFDKEEKKRAALRDYMLPPKRPLSLVPVAHETFRTPPPASYHRRDSAESFSMFPSSTDSSQRTKSVASSYSLGMIQNEENGHIDNSSRRAKVQVESGTHRDNRSATSILEADQELCPVKDQPDVTIGDFFPASNPPHLERPVSPVPFSAESWPLRPVSPGADRGLMTGAEHLNHASASHSNSVGRDDEVTTSDEQEYEPWSAHAMLREAIRFYANKSTADIQSAAHLLHKAHVLFGPCDPFLPYQERELILRTYNEQLLRQVMFTEAAELRRFCAPTYSSLYEYAQKDTFINVFCFKCKRPYENPVRDNLRCHRCGVAQSECVICMGRDPPAEWDSLYASEAITTLQETSLTETLTDSASFVNMSEEGKERDETQGGIPTPEPASAVRASLASGVRALRAHGSKLWLWCQGCGHGGHTACQVTWLRNTPISEGGCATPGCFHDCGPGPRREHYRSLTQENKRSRDSNASGRQRPRSAGAGGGFAKRDSWAAVESRAVERVRSMLGTAGGASVAMPTPPPSSASIIQSPKKVRVVIPGEFER